MAYRDHDAVHDAEKCLATKEERRTPEVNFAAREITVGELIDRRIEKAERLAKALYDLKNSLPGQFLNSGAHRVSAFLEL